MNDGITPLYLSGWLRFPNVAKFNAACKLVQDDLHLPIRQPEPLMLVLEDHLSYDIDAHYDPLEALNKLAVTGRLDLRFASPQVRRASHWIALPDRRLYGSGHEAGIYEHPDKVDHVLPNTYKPSDRMLNDASPFCCVAFSPDGNLCALAGGNNYVRPSDRASRAYVLLIDARTGTEIGRLYGHTGVVEALSFSTDGTKIALGDNRMTMRVYEVATGKVVASHKAQLHGFWNDTSYWYGNSSVADVCFLPDEQLLTIGGTHLAMWGGAALRLRRDIAVFEKGGPSLTHLEVSHDGCVAACLAEPTKTSSRPYHKTGNLVMLDLVQGAVTASLPGLFVDAAFAPDGASLATVESVDSYKIIKGHFDERLPASSPQYAKRIVLRDAASLREIWAVTAHGNPQCLIFAEDGQTIFTVGVEDGGVVRRTWSAVNGDLLAATTHPHRGARGACTDLAAHGGRLITVTDDAARMFEAGA